MRKKVWLTVLVIVMLCSAMIAGCGPQEEEPETSGLKINNKPQAAVEVGTDMTLDIEYPEGLNLTKVQIESTNRDVAKVKANKIYFTSEGTSTITVQDKNNAEVKDSFTVSVNPIRNLDIAFDLESQYAEEYFAPYRSTTVNNGQSVPLSDNWELKADGTLQCVPEETAKKDDIRTVYSLYLKDRKFTNFEIVFQYYKQEKYAEGDRGGCVGVMFGKSDRSRTSMDIGSEGDGDMLLMSGLGNLALWGPHVGHHMDPGNKAPSTYYRDDEWHLAKFRVYQNTIEGYIDDMKIPLLKKIVENDYPIEGEIALMSNANSTAQYRNISIRELTADGGEQEYISVSDIAIQNKQEFADVSLSSPSVMLDMEAVGAPTVEVYSFTSSNPSVAEVSEEGLVSFRGEGNVTITVRSLDNLSISDQVTFTVKEASESITITNQPETVRMTDVYTPVVQDQDGKGVSLSDLTVTSDDENVARVKDGKITFIQTGTVTVTVSKKDAPAISDSFSATVQLVDSQVAFSFTEASLDSFNFYKVVNNNPDATGPIEWSSAFELDAQTGTFSKTWKTGTTFVPANTYMAAVKDTNGEDLKLANVEMVFNFKTASGNLAYTGVAYGVQNHNTRPISGGAGNIACVTSNKNGVLLALDGNETGGLAQPQNQTQLTGFQKEIWHLMKVRIFGDQLIVFIDDMETPVVTKTLNKQSVSGAFGLYSIDGTASYRNFCYTALDADGNVVVQ